ncbi:MAG TPA: outer membrane beta-barrel domain-containing protein [Burkholderiaceae bacterium]
MSRPPLAFALTITLAATLSTALLAIPRASRAAEQAPGNDQVIEPQLDRRDVRVPHIPSNDVELGLFTGSYNLENFGSSWINGVRAGYHVTEDVFVEAAYGQTKVSDQTYRQILPGGIFPNAKVTLRYYDLSVGYNVLPGELFLGRSHAKVAALYLVAGVGSTHLLEERHQTLNVGFGTRVFLADWVALQLDLRDHLFALDVLGTRRDTQNLELTGGVTFFF